MQLGKYNEKLLRNIFSEMGIILISVLMIILSQIMGIFENTALGAFSVIIGINVIRLLSKVRQ